jgi:hypothetical protein
VISQKIPDDPVLHVLNTIGLPVSNENNSIFILLNKLLINVYKTTAIVLIVDLIYDFTYLINYTDCYSCAF